MQLTRIPLSPTSLAAVLESPITAGEESQFLEQLDIARQLTMFRRCVSCILWEPHYSRNGRGIDHTSFIVHVLELGAHAVHHCLHQLALSTLDGLLTSMQVNINYELPFFVLQILNSFNVDSFWNDTIIIVSILLLLDVVQT